MSKESDVADQNDLSEVLESFSVLKTSREFDFSVLMSDMARNHQEHISRAAFEGGNSRLIIKEMSVVSTKLPWILDLEIKKRTLKYGFVLLLIESIVGRLYERTLQT